MNRVYTFPLFFLLLMFVPAEIHLVLGGIRVEPYRVLLLVYLIVGFQNLIKEKYQLKELYLLIFLLLASISLLINHGASGIQSSIILFLETFICYFIGKQITQKNGRLGLVWVLKVFLVGFLVMVPLAVIESQNGYRITHVIASKLAGTWTESYLGDSYIRYGLYRSSVTFSHPILYSVIAALFFLLSIKSFFSAKQRIYSYIAYLTALITAVTSAGIMMVSIQFGLIITERLRHLIPKIYNYVIAFGVLIIIFLELFSNRGAIKVLMTIMALNPYTAWARYNQWTEAWDDVTDNWYIGIGFNDWSRPFWMGDSIDSYWLLMFLRFGLIATSFLILFWFATTRDLYSANRKYNDKALFYMFISVLSLIIGVVTVALFDRALLIAYFTLGIFNGYLKNIEDERRT